MYIPKLGFLHSFKTSFSQSNLEKNYIIFVRTRDNCYYDNHACILTTMVGNIKYLWQHTQCLHPVCSFRAACWIGADVLTDKPTDSIDTWINRSTDIQGHQVITPDSGATMQPNKPCMEVNKGQATGTSWMNYPTHTQHCREIYMYIHSHCNIK